MATLTLERVSAVLGDQTVLHDVSLAVEEGELLVLVGPSGCGKSTLLRLVAGLVRPSSGTIRIGARRVDELEPRERDVAMVFQNYALYPHKTVARNLSFPLEIRRLPRAEIRARVHEAAELLGLSDLLARKPGELSGGQMQRVALGRAIVRKPALFLFDEPLSNLDARLRTEMRAEIARLHRRLGITSLYVTHDQAEAMTLGSRIAVLDRGRIEQLGRPLDVYARPATRFVAGFIGSPAMNLIRCPVEDGRVSLGALALPAPAGARRELVLGVRPHELRLAPAAPGELELELPVTLVEAFGSATLVHLDLVGRALVAAAEGMLDVRAGESRRVACARSALHAFDAATGARVEWT